MTIIDDLGQTITIKEITRAYDEYGDATDSSSSTTVTGMVEIVGSSDEIVKSGILNTGDAIGYFKPTNSSEIKAGNKVTYQGVDYTIKSVDMHDEFGGTQHHIEAQLTKDSV